MGHVSPAAQGVAGGFLLGVIMEIEEAIGYILEGESVLFLGAGYSAGATNIQGKPIINGRDLNILFKERCSIVDDISLDFSAETFQEQYGPDEMISLLTDQFICTSVKAHHRIIAEQPWKMVYTTNFDNVFEFASNKCKKKIVPALINEEPSSFSKQRICLHINGYIERLSAKNLNKHIKLISTSYLDDYFNKSKWSYIFRQDIRMAKSVFFIGYSLYDIDIARIIYSSDSIFNKCFFIVGDSCPDWMINKINKCGVALKINAQDIAHKITEAKKDFSPTVKPLDDFAYLEEYIPPVSHKDLMDSDVFELLFFGSSEPSLIGRSLENDSGFLYYVPRKVLFDIKDHLLNGGKNILIHSDLGNGKTLIIDGLKNQLRQHGYRIFSIASNNDDTFREIENAIQLKGKKVFVVENYQHYLNVLKFLHNKRDYDTHLVVTARSLLHDIFYDRLNASLDHADIMEFDVNRLDHLSIKTLLHLFDKYGLWGSKAHLLPRPKKHYLENEANGQLQLILVQLFESPVIINKYKELMSLIRTDETHKETLLAILILNTIGIKSTIELISTLTQSSSINRSSFHSNEAIRQIINSDAGSIHLRSPITSRYFLHELGEGQSLSKLLIKIARSCQANFNNDQVFSDILRSLVVYGQLQSLLPEKNKRVAIKTFYEDIKNLSYCKNSPYFWLQYAIARLVLEDFEEARAYFKHAYGLAKGMADFNTYQIDNHWARFLIVYSIKRDDDEFADHLLEAHAIISTQIYRGENGQYPYKIARLYPEVIQKYFERITDYEKESIANACRAIIDSIPKLPDKIRGHKTVIECDRSLKRAIRLF